MYLPRHRIRPRQRDLRRVQESTQPEPERRSRNAAICVAEPAGQGQRMSTGMGPAALLQPGQRPHRSQLRAAT